MVDVLYEERGAHAQIVICIPLLRQDGMSIVKMWNGKSKSEQLVGGKALAVMGTVKLPALTWAFGRCPQHSTADR